MRPSDGGISECDFDLFESGSFVERIFHVLRRNDDFDFGFIQVFLDSTERYETLERVDENIGNDVESETEPGSWNRLAIRPKSYERRGTHSFQTARDAKATEGVRFLFMRRGEV